VFRARGEEDEESNLYGEVDNTGGKVMNRIDILNELARPFLRKAYFVTQGEGKFGRLKIFLPVEFYSKAKSRFLAADLNSQRTYFRHNNVRMQVGMGGTDERTLVNLILWYRGLPRLPGRVLKHWQERTEAFAAGLDTHGYDDKHSLNCVLCGQPYVGLDWWSLGEVTGPCCSFGKCQERVRHESL
jgi:hypothetical protein